MPKLPQLLLLALMLMGLLFSARRHGQMPKQKPENFWTSLVAWLLQMSLLYWAGLYHWIF